MENSMNPSNMMPGQMYPPAYYYPYMAMNQPMMPPYQHMNMGFQYPPGFPGMGQMNMPFMNPQMNLMENLNNAQENGEIEGQEVEKEKIHTENPLKIIKKKDDKQKSIELESSDSEEEEEKREIPSKKEKTQRIDFNQSEDEVVENPEDLKPKIKTIPNEKVEEDVRKKEEIVAKELTEKEILMNKVKNQKALEEIKVDKKILKILVEIAKKIPKKKSRLLRQKIKWNLLEKVNLTNQLTQRKKSSKTDYHLGSTKSRSSCWESKKTRFPKWSFNC